MLHKNLMKILSVGYGAIGKPLTDALIKKGNNVSVVTKNSVPKNINNHFQGVQSVQGTYDMILLSTKQSQIQELMNNMPSSIYNKDTIFVSTLPGASQDFFYNHFGNAAKIALLTPIQNTDSRWTISLLYNEPLPIFHDLGKVYYMKSFAEMQKMNALNSSGIALAYQLIEAHKESVRNMDLDMSDGDLEDLTLSVFESGMDYAKNNDKLDSMDVLNRAIGNTDKVKFGSSYVTKLGNRNGARQLSINMIAAAKMSLPDIKKQRDLVTQCEEFSSLV